MRSGRCTGTCRAHSGSIRALIYWGREAMGYGFLHPRVNQFLQRAAEAHLRRQVRDPRLRAKVTPRFVMGCKRILISNDYLPALGRPTSTW